MGTSQTEHLHHFYLNQLAKRFLSVRKKTEDLCHVLSDEDMALSFTEHTSPAKVEPGAVAVGSLHFAPSLQARAASFKRWLC
jgi:hypothetical protein